MRQQPDLRVQKTQRLIKHTFLQLMKEKGYRNITITDISKLAQINRKTFYFHYESIEALYEEISDDYLALLDFSTLLSTLEIDLEHSDFLSTAVSILERVNLQKEPLKILMNDYTNSQFNEKLKYFLSETFTNTMKLRDYAAINGFPFSLVQNIYCNLFFEIIRWWINQSDISSRRAVEIMLSMFSDNTLDAMGVQLSHGS